jgi:hypothetical protein
LVNRIPMAHRMPLDHRIQLTHRIPLSFRGYRCYTGYQWQIEDTVHWLTGYRALAHRIPCTCAQDFNHRHEHWRKGC